MFDFSKMTQNEMISYHLKKYGSITQNEAKDLYGVTRLPSRMHELKCCGFPFKVKMVTDKNKFGKLCTHAEYCFERK